MTQTEHLGSIPDQKVFIEQFQLPFSDYGDPVEFIDGHFGFSVLREYPNEYASLFRIYITQDSLKAKQESLPVTITASYGKKFGDAITTYSSVEKIKSLFDPLEVTTNDEFFYHPETKVFTFKRRKIEPREILRKIDNWHRKPTKWFFGFWLRIKLIFWRVIVLKSLQAVSSIFVFLLYLVAQESISRNIWRRVIHQNRLAEEEVSIINESKDRKTISFLGYAASAWTIAIYCTIHLFGYLVAFYFEYRPGILVTIFKNSFLTIVYVVVTLSILEFVVPKALRYLIQTSDFFFHRAAYKRIRI